MFPDVGAGGWQATEKPDIFQTWVLEVGRQRKNQPLNGNVHCYGIYIPILNVKDNRCYVQKESYLVSSNHYG
jgi:hypothetical protein